MHRVIASAVLVLIAASLSACTGEDAGGTSSTAAVGDAAPPFSLASTEGRTVSLEDYVGRKPVLLYFSMGPG